MPLVAAVLTRLGFSIAAPAPAYLTVLAVIGLVGWVRADLPAQWVVGANPA